MSLPAEDNPYRSPKPNLRDLARPGAAIPRDERGLTADERDRIARWRDASYEEHGRVLADLLDFVDSMRPLKPRRGAMFPGWRSFGSHPGEKP